MSSAPKLGQLCGRFTKLERHQSLPGQPPATVPRLRPFDALLPVFDEVERREAWLLPVHGDLIGGEIERSYFLMGASQNLQLKAERAILPSFVEREAQWFWLGYWKHDLMDFATSKESPRGAIVEWALGVAKNLQELSVLGKHHGLVQPGVILQDSGGLVRMWGGVVAELLNPKALAAKAERESAAHEVAFAPGILAGQTMSFAQDLYGFAAAVASRWFALPGRRALLRLQREAVNEGWANELKRLLIECQADPAPASLTHPRDLVARLEDIADLVIGEAPRLETSLHDFGELEGPMPSLEDIDLSVAEVVRRASSHYHQAPSKKGSRRPTVAPGSAGVHAANQAPLRTGAPSKTGRQRAVPTKSRVPWLALGGAAFASVAAGTWFLAQGGAPWALSNKEEGAADPEIVEQVPAPEASAKDLAKAAGLSSCPPYAAQLPEGGCMDRFEYPGEGQLPRVSLTKNQAQLLCKAREGRLCSAHEWRSACELGKPDLSGCQLRASSQERHKLRPSTPSDCAHAGHFFDLIGNAAEWVADGSARGGDAQALRKRASCKLSKTKLKGNGQGFLVGFRCCYDSSETSATAREEPAPKAAAKGRG